MASQTVVITGGMGFIGRHVVELLVERGYLVHILSRSVPRESSTELSQRYSAERYSTERYSAERYGAAVRLHRVDLHDTDTVAPLIKRIRASHMLHAAWDTRHGLFWNSPENLDWIVTSKLLLQAFIDAGGERFVGVGTCAEYDWEAPDVLYTEGVTKLLPATMYGQSKLAFRKSLATLSQHHGLSAAWGRVFLLFGPHEGPQRLVSSAVLSLVRGEAFAASAGDQIRDFSDVRDVAAGFVALLASNVPGDVNIASGEARTVASVLMAIGEQLGRSELIKLGARTRPEREPARIVASVERLRSEVRWRPTASFNERLEETIEWWKEHLTITHK
jgi:nucleoside-diphosphate-sugar epimerase